ncbi:MAG: cofactor-independent phosphoglycerate mutase [Candidatus Omnitrophica bacterium]|nr:cofactor-independent phosphoglycerate mutase [Candidatus Omnitrophota bacterium]HOX54550.1 cofactor-independent phosphoglycerate mutase [Candidatus Omnitrophota bacterium]
MKYVVLVPDGMCDYPLEELQGRTPLEVAHKDNINFIAANGQVGMVSTVPAGMTPASDVANLSILGYDPKKYYTGRGPLEAANLGVELAEGDVAFRCNLVTIENDKMVDYSAGHITSKEASILIKSLDVKLGSKTIKFYHGVSYRHLMVIKNTQDVDFSRINCTPPHDILGKDIARYLPRGKGAGELINLMNASKEVLLSQDINHVRIDLKENPANMIWLWSPGKTANIPSFVDKYGVSGAVISAVDLIKGMGKIMGLEVINVPGATGYYDTNYSGKAEHAIKALKTNDFVFIHVEATDEAGHNGDLRMKIACFERIDREIIGPILKHFENKEDFRIMVVPDHATPISARTHVSDPVCFAVYGTDIPAGTITTFDEKSAKDAQLKFEHGYQLMDYLIKGIK